jgi:Ca2+-binding EF-hand superfamily protein
LQNEKLQNIEDIFAAADLNQNGILELAEIKTLYKVLGSQHHGDVHAQQSEARKIFEEYAELHPNKKNELGMPTKGIGPK